MRVITACEYLLASERPAGHWAAFKFVRALKAEEFRGYPANIPVCGRSMQLTMSNRDDALGWAGQILEGHVDGEFGPGAHVALVPVPGSQCVSPQDVSQSRVYRIAEAIAVAHGTATWTARPVLHWDHPMQRAHGAGGSRRASELYPHYVATAPKPLDRAIWHVVLVDDVLTGGGHLRAAAACLRKAGYRVADVCVAAARSVWPEDDASRSPSDDAFSVASEELDPFDP